MGWETMPPAVLREYLVTLEQSAQAFPPSLPKNSDGPGGGSTWRGMEAPLLS